MKNGIYEYDGVIISTDNHFDYYKANQENTRTMLMRPSQPTHRVQTLKTDYPVTVANNQITVVVYPDGNIEIKPSEGR